MLKQLFNLTGDYQFADMPIGDALLYSALGIAVVFFGLVCLIVVIKLMQGGSGEKAEKKEAAPAAAPAAPVAAAPVAAAPAGEKKLANGTAGEVLLSYVPDRTAAMIMAIVADETKIPLNELRFISIREVK